MNNSLKYLTRPTALAVAVLFATSASATIYTDTTGDLNDGTVGDDLSVWPHLDITSVEVSNDNSDITFKITLDGDILAVNWGKYMIGIDSVSGGDTAGNGWGRPISMSSGMDYFIGSWVDSGNGAEVRSWDGSVWNLDLASYNMPPDDMPVPSTTQYSVTITAPLASLGLSIGDSFDFDVYSSGGGGTDSAVDALANPAVSITTWAGPYDSGANVYHYTVVTPTDPTNMVTFLVNMEAPIADGYFIAGEDDLYIRGGFNGWLDPDPTSNTNAPNWIMTQDVGNTYGYGTNVYYGTFPITGFNGREYGYKYWSLFTIQYDTGGYEYTMLSCGANRNLTITNQGASQTQPLDYFSDRSLADPTTAVTFSVDMSVQETVGNFSSNDTVYCRGNFNAWDMSFPLTNNPNGFNPYLYSGTQDFTAPCGACFPYKFFYGTNSWEKFSTNREFYVDCANGTLPVRFFNDESPCDLLVETNFITFTVDLSQAVAVTNNVAGPSYDGTWDVYLNGQFLDWLGWNTNSLANYQMTQVSGTSNYSITLPFRPGTALRMEYKYGANIGDPGNLDNEAGFAQNHVRWIRTTPGQTNYSVSDVWTGTNAMNIANLAEDQVSLAIQPGTPGNVQLDWWGLHCASLQSATNPAGPWIDLFGAPGVASTNLPAAGGQQYFRMSQP